MSQTNQTKVVELGDKQIDFLINSDARICFLDGAIRSGKTHIMNLKWLEYIITGPAGILLMAGKTIRTLERNVLKSENGIFDLLGEGNYKYNSSTGELKIAGRTIYCVGANDEKAENKIRGMTLAGVYFDEVSLFPKSFVEQAQGRCSVKDSQLFFTSNPDSPFHYLKSEYIDNPDFNDGKMLKHWRFFMEDNPYLLKYNPEYIEYAKKTFKGVFYKRNVQGEWCVAEGRVYPHFEEDIHVVDKLPDDFKSIHIGIDWGAVHPTTFVMVGKGHDNKLYVIKEYCQRGRKNAQLASDLIDFMDGYKINGITVDSAAASFILELKSRKIMTKDCNKAVEDGISHVSSLLAEEELFIHKSCKNLIKEFYSYSWDEKKSQASGKDVVIKLSDDVQDALRYCLLTFYSKKNNKLKGSSLYI